MPKRKRYPRLRNGFGSIRKLSGNRKKPYAVFAPSTYRDERGYQLYDKALAYCETWETGFSVLLKFHTGQYKRGDNLQNLLEEVEHAQLLPVVNKILSKLNIGTIEGETFSQVYDKFIEWKFSENNRKLSKSALNAYKAAYKNCTKLHNKVFVSLKTIDLQNVVDECPLKHSSKELIVNLFKQMYKYADIHELIEKDYSTHVTIKTKNDDIKGVPFTEDNIKTLWNNADNPVCANILILIYSGLRISEYETAEINLKEGYFFGGVKTDAGKNRYIPIHSAIAPLIKQHPNRLNDTIQSFRISMYETLERLGIEKHTPHDCRHTFAMLCDENGIKETDKKMMMGHAFQA
nr:site-specific integrase [uncultured Catonella sp.]